jgi:hypothetical protein
VPRRARAPGPQLSHRSNRLSRSSGRRRSTSESKKPIPRPTVERWPAAVRRHAPAGDTSADLQ